MDLFRYSIFDIDGLGAYHMTQAFGENYTPTSNNTRKYLHHLVQ